MSRPRTSSNVASPLLSPFRTLPLVAGYLYAASRMPPTSAWRELKRILVQEKFAGIL
jgi:hypothetical protein